MTLLEYLKQLMGRKGAEPAPASVERSEPDETAATKKQPPGGDMLPSYRTMKYKSPIWGYFHVQKE